MHSIISATRPHLPGMFVAVFVVCMQRLSSAVVLQCASPPTQLVGSSFPRFVGFKSTKSPVVVSTLGAWLCPPVAFVSATVATAHISKGRGRTRRAAWMHPILTTRPIVGLRSFHPGLRTVTCVRSPHPHRWSFPFPRDPFT